MATTTKFDELNILASEVVDKKPCSVLSIEDFFGEMDLEKEEIERRISLAHNVYNILVFILTFIKATEVSGGTHDVAYYVDYIKRNLGETYQQFFGDDRYQDRVDSLAEQLINTTMNHIGSEYYTSSDRATVDAENETNIVCNDDIYQKSVASGFTKKMWITKRDKRVRHTHVLVDSEVVDIKKPFEVGTSELMFPCDLSLGANLKEIANCRCTCKYF